MAKLDFFTSCALARADGKFKENFRKKTFRNGKYRMGKKIHKNKHIAANSVSSLMDVKKYFWVWVLRVWWIFSKFHIFLLLISTLNFSYVLTELRSKSEVFIVKLKRVLRWKYEIEYFCFYSIQRKTGNSLFWVYGVASSLSSNFIKISFNADWSLLRTTMKSRAKWYEKFLTQRRRQKDLLHQTMNFQENLLLELAL